MASTDKSDNLTWEIIYDTIMWKLSLSVKIIIGVRDRGQGKTMKIHEKPWKLIRAIARKNQENSGTFYIRKYVKIRLIHYNSP
jgi:hypothetical protein